jgi:hypothetical protein
VLFPLTYLRKWYACRRRLNTDPAVPVES